MRRIAFFEDQYAKDFAPIASLQPVFELLCGHFSNRERVLRELKPEVWGAFIRPELVETYAEKQPDAILNSDHWIREFPVLFINARCLIPSQFLSALLPGQAAWIGETLGAFHAAPNLSITPDHELTNDELVQTAWEMERVDVDGTVLRYPWDLIPANPIWLTKDFHSRTDRAGESCLDTRVAIVGNADQVWIDPTSKIDPFVVIDASAGPVWIERDVRIQAFTRIEGPAYIGQGTQLFRANVREGCSFGPVCRIGGEIEETIIQGYSNKYHDGFLGHSYIGLWVNLGALTSNSDLKSDYSDVSVPLGGVSTKTGSTKVGCFIGDHTKTAIGSLFNTGSSIGAMSLILPRGELLPKHIPPFTRVWHGEIETRPDGVASAFQTARIAMSRRNQELTPAMERLLTFHFEQTGGDREKAFERSRK
ncbi:putative sugar nucleotidyl transferase [Planctomicrobium sp. SH668]|uniref:putative sugar nucleotidyl transferase n=1 Tax=Planctomicrobium sp. SH668 TaxID=3448126 RepID=UPI003F5C38CD